jgi:hypothetical protein
MTPGASTDPVRQAAAFSANPRVKLWTHDQMHLLYPWPSRRGACARARRGWRDGYARMDVGFGASEGCKSFCL